MTKLPAGLQTLRVAAEATKFRLSIEKDPATGLYWVIASFAITIIEGMQPHPVRMPHEDCPVDTLDEALEIYARVIEEHGDAPCERVKV